MKPPKLFDPSVSTYLTSPASPGKRRRHLRESEETEGEMPVEVYLYKSDPYRTSSFQVPLPLPFLAEDPPRALQIDGGQIRPHVPAMVDILKNNSFERSQVHLNMKLISKPGYPNGNAKHLTLVVDVDQGVNIRTSTWTRARDELVRTFAKQGLPQVKVEMYDRDRAFMPSLFALRSQGPLIEAYEAVREKLLDRIESRLGSGWRAMSVFNLGPHSTTAKPTLVVFVQPGLLRDWKSIEAELQHILRGQPGTQIEFLPGNVGDLASETSWVPLRSFEATLGQFPAMGTSIGEVGKPGAGTLGGFVRLECNGKVHNGVLTNHHVVRPVLTSQQVADSVNQHGYGMDGPPAITLIQYPAVNDLRADILISTANRNVLQQEVDALQERLQSIVWKDQDPPETLTSSLKQKEGGLKIAKLVQSTLEQLPTTLGRVLYSSGDLISANSTIMDWAFIELQHAAAIPEKNRLPDHKLMSRLDERSRTH